MKFGHLLASALAAGLFFTQASADTTKTFGDAGTDRNGISPFYRHAFKGAVYQIVYDATAFSGPVNISAVSFFRDPDDIGFFSNVSFDIGWYLSATAFDQSRMPLSTNRGAKLADWATLALRQEQFVPATFTISGPDFTYDPSQGDLLLDFSYRSGDGRSYPNVTSFRGSGPGSGRVANSNSYLGRDLPNGDTNIGGAITALTFASADTPPPTSADPSPAAVPLPAGAPLLIAGLGGFAVLRSVKKRRTKDAS